MYICARTRVRVLVCAFVSVSFSYSNISTGSRLGSWANSSTLQGVGSTVEGDLWGFDGSIQDWKRRRFCLNGLVSSVQRKRDIGAQKRCAYVLMCVLHHCCDIVVCC
jgi:hypothetical protein